jgi:fructokinase
MAGRMALPLGVIRMVLAPAAIMFSIAVTWPALSPSVLPAPVSSLAPSFLASAWAPSFIFTKKGLVSVLVIRPITGSAALRSIRQEGIAEDALVLCDAPTTLSLVGVDAQGVPSYRFYGHAAADRQLLPEHLERLPAQVAAIHLGSYACVVPPVDATLRQLVEQRRADSVIAYDPNVRLNVEPDLGVWRQQVDWMAHRCDLLKLSDEDFERLYPGVDPQAKAEEWLSLGVCLVMLTRGGSGATAWICP